MLTAVPHDLPTSLGASLPRVSEDSLINLAHDLRQPLSSIESIAYCLDLTIRPDQVQAHIYIARLQQMVLEASAILSAAISDSQSSP